MNFYKLKGEMKMCNRLDYEMPTSRQLAAAARYGINVTSEMDAQDVSDLLSRQLRQDNGSSIPIQYMGKLSNTTTKCCID